MKITKIVVPTEADKEKLLKVAEDLLGIYEIYLAEDQTAHNFIVEIYTRTIQIEVDPLQSMTGW